MVSLYLSLSLSLSLLGGQHFLSFYVEPPAVLFPVTVSSGKEGAIILGQSPSRRRVGRPSSCGTPRPDEVLQPTSCGLLFTLRVARPRLQVPARPLGMSSWRGSTGSTVTRVYSFQWWLMFNYTGCRL